MEPDILTNDRIAALEIAVKFHKETAEQAIKEQARLQIENEDLQTENEGLKIKTEGLQTENKRLRETIGDLTNGIAKYILEARDFLGE